MSNQIKAGKKPISAKPAQADYTADDLFGNNLSLDPDIQAELKAEGKVARFVDAKKLYEMNGHHARGWTVYKRKNKNGTIDPTGFKFGSDPEGIIRRGSLILAVKTEEQAAKHKTYLQQKADSQLHIQRDKAEELRRFAKQNKLDTVIDDSYDDDEEKS